jgi:ribonuclease R
MSSTRYARIADSNGGTVAVDLFDPESSYPLHNAAYLPDSIVTYALHDGSCRVESLVAAAGSALAVIWLALSEHGGDPAFPESVNVEVQSIIENPGIDESSLSDLTGLPFVTIDNVDSRDLDQAMHITRQDNGYVLYYALADAAHFVRPGSALFNEALRRGASYYVPGFAVPMLPRALSEDLVSLNASVPRRALVFTIGFDSAGRVLQTNVQQARIQSAAKLSYSGVEAYYQSPQTSDLAGQSFTPTLDNLRELGLLRIEEAHSRNVVEYDRSSVEVYLSDDGSDFNIVNTDRLAVEQYNEQISLVCNSEGARLLEAAGLPSVVQAVYRVHDAPDTERLKKFSRLLRGLIRHYRLPENIWVWRWRDGKYGEKENLSDYLSRLRAHDVDSGLLSAVQRHALMLSPASRFSSEAGGHHSLQLDQYARFSSPMREIAGVFTHREYLQYLAFHSDAAQDFNDEALREQVIEAANRSKEVQKKLNKAVMKKAIDQLFVSQLPIEHSQRSIWQGTVIALRKTRVYVRLDMPSITVKIYLRELARANGADYKLDRSTAVITNGDSTAFALGQRLKLRVRDYSQGKLRWGLEPV